MENPNSYLSFIKDLEGYRIFCHFTDKDPELIINGDLGLEQPKWYTTMLELSNYEIENLESFLEEYFKKSTGNFRDSAIIIAVPEDLEYNFVVENDGARVKNMDYIVENQYILCSIDNIRKEIIFNDYALAREEIFYR